MDNQDKLAITKEIKVQRLRQNKTQEACANVLSISIPTYRELEYNPNKFDIEQMIILSKFLEWDFFEFFKKIYCKIQENNQE